MKKFLAIILTACMMLAIVPVFASFATPDPTAPTYADAISGKTAFDSTVASSGGCGFLDGNMTPALTANADSYFGTNGKPAMYIYINGVIAEYNPNHSGRNAGGGIYYAIYNATFDSDDALTITFVFPDTGYYTECVCTAPMSSLGYTSSNAVIKGGRAFVQVSFTDSVTVSDHFTVGSTVTAKVHDDHTERIFTVTEIKGQTVIFTCNAFGGTSKTLLEMGFGTANAFSLMIDANTSGGTLGDTAANSFNAYIQKKPGTTSGSDYRFIFTADYSYLNNGYSAGVSVVQTAAVKFTFLNGDTTVKSYTSPLSSFTFMESVLANGECWYAAEDEVLCGAIITNIPTFAWSEIIVTIENGGATIYSGSATKDIKEIVAMGGYTWLNGEENINASTGKNSGDESSIYLFDKTSTKYGYHSGGADQTITWNYPTAKTVSLYAIYTGNDTAGAKVNRNPNSWEFSGSADGTNWTVIDSVATPNMPTEGGQGAYYTVDTPAAYQYYKITFKVNSAYFQLGEIKLYETAASVSYSFNNTINGETDITADPAATYGHESQIQLFDDNNSSKYGYYSYDKSVFTFTWKYDSAKTARGYGILTGNDSTRENRNPNSWVLYGSSDGTEYVELDSVAVGGNFSNEYMIYGIDTPAVYQYYKIVFTLNSTNQFQMAELSLFD